MNQLPDILARQEALNSEYSYIVQAPAGSGKTELLTQRFLKLLTCVEHPESIIALTFTKKAAREMRHRILSTLAKVAEKKEIMQPETERLAKLVLAQDKKYGWHLLKSSNRLRVQTIDSLCASLVSKMPILSQGAPYAAITSDAQSCYQEAAERCLMEGQQNPYYKEAIQIVLLHRGNHYKQSIELLADMLSWREKWLPYIVSAQEKDTLKFRAQLESALKNLVEEAETHLDTLFSEERKKELQQLLAFAEKNRPLAFTRLHRKLDNFAFNSRNESFENRSLQDVNEDSKKMNDEEIKQKKQFPMKPNKKWQKIAHLLLTQDNNWRTRIDKNLGFPSPSESKNAEEKNFLKSMKTQLENLLNKLQRDTQSEAFRLALENYRLCPPTTYSDNQWKILQALITLLPLLAAQLKTVFAEKQMTDFSEIAEQASNALGQLGDPSELALYLDYRIQHLLIDEFQDTSLKQFRLLEKLTDGWENGDGRTLFVVGDPMQSIYRFREADVSLFLKARQFGVGNINLRPLTLCCNFRSRPELIDWVNTCFQSIFPSQDDTSLSAVKHHLSQAGRDEYYSKGQVHFYPHETSQHQAINIVEQILHIPADETIAILVQARSQLFEILKELRQAKISFQGIDIDPLSSRPCIQDLYSLTQALLQPANRLAWFSVLRAPWCGLKLADLLVLAQHKLSLEEREKLLSEEALKRFTSVQHILRQAHQDRQKQSLSGWIEQTWRALGGHLCIDNRDHVDIEKFWELLDEYTYEDFDLSQDLLRRIERLFSNTSQESRLHIMTIHKSKGLEFDHIILPHLEASIKKKDTFLLQHMERRTARHKNDLLLATMRSIDEQQDNICQYFQYLNEKKDIFERQRLLYVALTRARTQIHLHAIQKASQDNLPVFNEFSATTSFLKWLRPYLPPSSILNENHIINSGNDAKISSTLSRLPLKYFQK